MLSPEHLSDACFFGLLTLLETLPIQAALLVYAAAYSGSLAMTFGPLWLIVAALLAFALARWQVGRLSPALLTLAGLVIGVVVFALFVALSPTGYGETLSGLVSFEWIQRLRADATLDTPHFNRLFAIAPFVVYLGWRGMALGGRLPRIDHALRRFTFSLAAVMLACVGALAVPASAQASLQSALLALLALEVFAGLSAAALARRGAGRESAQGEATGAEASRWLLTALGAAALVVAVAFGMGLAFNLRLASPLGAALGYVGEALSTALVWLAVGFAYILWFLFGGILDWLLSLHGGSTSAKPKTPPGIPKQPIKHAVLTPPPHALVVAITVLIALLVTALVVVVLYRVIRAALSALRVDTDPEVDEEREALDARGLLRRQLSDLLAGWRRRPDVAADPLGRGGVRWRYRELLRAGAAAGVARRDGETADEYSERLARVARERGAGELALSRLTRAYDDARYGERDEAAPPDAVEEARAAATALAKLGEGR